MSPRVERLIGPRLNVADIARPRFIAPSVLMFSAAVLLLVSFFFPYWKMTLHAPQYPQGLHVRAFLNRLEGDVREIDGLNHYIGMRPLNEAAQMERAQSLVALGVLALLLVSGIFVHNRWAALLALPAMLFPAGFLLDLFYWLHTFGQNLDPHAALSNSVKPFTPPVLGTGAIGQFRTVAAGDVGLWMAVGASSLVLVGLWFHRRAYKPLIDARLNASTSRIRSSALKRKGALAS